MDKNKWVSFKGYYNQQIYVCVEHITWFQAYEPNSTENEKTDSIKRTAMFLTGDPDMIVVNHSIDDVIKTLQA